jgi:MarR family transcriptional regulator, organic hydroperoxide resistance regulator
MVEKKILQQYIERLETSFYTTMRTLGPEISDHLEEGLTGDQFFILQIIEKKGRVISSELAEEFRVKPSAITAMIDRMIKNDFVTRERDEKDRRVVYIKMTEKGKQSFEKSEKKRIEIIERYMSQLEREELESLVSIYEKLAKIALSSEGEK